MRSWSKETIELSLTRREADRLLKWLDDTCTDRTRDGPGFSLAFVLRRALQPENQ